MAGIAIGLLWGAYTLGFYGYCLSRNYNVTPKMLLSPNWPPSTVDNNSDSKPSPGNNSGGGFPGPWPGAPKGYRPPGSK